MSDFRPPTQGIDLKTFFEASAIRSGDAAHRAPAPSPICGTPIGTSQRWGEITQAFEDNFFAYAFWFN